MASRPASSRRQIPPNLTSIFSIRSISKSALMSACACVNAEAADAAAAVADPLADVADACGPATAAATSWPFVGK